MSSIVRTGEPDDRAVLKNYLIALAELMDVTADLLDKQLVPLRKLADWAPKFEEFAKRRNFWENAVVDLRSSDVANLFFTLNQLTDLYNRMTKVGSLKRQEQDSVVKEFKEATSILNEVLVRFR